jgi:hypothetical protein
MPPSQRNEQHSPGNLPYKIARLYFSRKSRQDFNDFCRLGGSAGAVVASRLSDISEWKVLLLEAGPDEPPGAEVPSMVAMFLGKLQLDLSCTQPCPLRRAIISIRQWSPGTGFHFYFISISESDIGVPDAELEHATELVKIKSPDEKDGYVAREISRFFHRELPSMIRGRSRKAETVAECSRGSCIIARAVADFGRVKRSDNFVDRNRH